MRSHWHASRLLRHRWLKPSQVAQAEGDADALVQWEGEQEVRPQPQVRREHPSPEREDLMQQKCNSNGM